MRKRHLLLAVVAASLLGACASMRDHYRETTSPMIVTTGDSFTVSPYILYFDKDSAEVEIVWRVPPDSKWRFAEDKGPGADKGIVVNGEIKTVAQEVPRSGERRAGAATAAVVIDSTQHEIDGCMRRSAFEYVCRNHHTRPGIYKYTIRLTDGTHDYILDPMVDNW
jgi:hypothetical protein